MGQELVGPSGHLKLWLQPPGKDGNVVGLEVSQILLNGLCFVGTGRLGAQDTAEPGMGHRGVPPDEGGAIIKLCLCGAV